MKLNFYDLVEFLHIKKSKTKRKILLLDKSNLYFQLLQIRKYFIRIKSQFQNNDVSTNYQLKVVNIALVIPQYLLKQRSSKIALSEIRLLFLKFISLQRSRGSSKVLSFRRIVLPLSQIVINPHISLHFVATLRIL